MKQFKRKLATFTSMLAFLSLSTAVVFANGAVTPGGVEIGSNANIIGTVNTEIDNKTVNGLNRTDINTTGGRGAISRQDLVEFGIGKDSWVNYGFSGISQTAITRVLGGKTSEILGKFTSSCISGSNCGTNAETGRVILINPAGVIFGQGAMVDINSLTTSTFDIKGIKNVVGKNVTDATDFNANGNELVNQMYSGGNYTYLGRVNFDSNYTAAFEGAGLKNADNLIRNSKIEAADKAQFSHWSREIKDVANKKETVFDFNNELTGSKNTNKSLAFVSNNIDYKDSLLKTGGNYNYKTGTSASSLSNVKMITADGVTFTYLSSGYINDQNVADDSAAHTDIARSINMDNSLLGNQAAIESGDVLMYQKSSTDDVNNGIHIKNSIVKANKLVSYGDYGVPSDGNIQLIASNDVSVDNSRLQTVNTQSEAVGKFPSKSSKGNSGGRVAIASTNKDVTISNSNIVTAGSTSDSLGGEARVIAQNGNVNITDTKVVADGRVDVQAKGTTDVSNSLLYANNVTDSVAKDLTVLGLAGVNVANSDLAAKGNATLLAGNKSNGKLTGDINISGTKNGNYGIEAGNKLTIKGKNTTIDNVTLAYNDTSDLSFYDSDKKSDTTGDYTNNVTIKNGTAFNPANSNDITVETNGNLTFDKATVQKNAYGIKSVNDTGAINGVSYEKEAASRTNAANLNVESTNANVTVQNSSNIVATGDITATAAGDYTQDASSIKSTKLNVKINAGKDAIIANNSSIASNKKDINVTAQDEVDIANASKLEAANNVKVTANNNVNITGSNVIAGSDGTDFDAGTVGNAEITSNNGAVNIKNNSSVVSQDDSVKITSHDTVKFGKQGAAGTTIDNTSNIQAENYVTITANGDNADITGEKADMPIIKYGERLTFDANRDNVFTASGNDVETGSLKSVNVDYIAGNSNRIYTEGDAQFVNSSFESKYNLVESGKDVIMNNLEIKNATTNPEDTVTRIYANGNVTTHNVTNEDLGAKDIDNKYHSFPQSVDTNRVARKSGETVAEYNKRIDSLDKNKDNPGVVNVNDTKLTVTTRTVKDSKNPDNGSITLVLNGATNDQAGVELDARNVKSLSSDKADSKTGLRVGFFKTGTDKWDSNIKVQQGPEIVADAADGKLAIKELYSDKLTLDKDDVMIADKTSGKPVITVKDQGGFNLDPTLNYPTPNPDDFTYDENYKNRVVDTKTSSVIEFDPDGWSTPKVIRTWNDPDGTQHTEYLSVRDGNVTDTTTTTSIDEEHTIKFNNDGTPSDEFTLVYDKQKTDTDVSTRVITGQSIYDDPTRTIPPDVKKPDGTAPEPEDFILITEDETPCDELPEMMPSTPTLSMSDSAKFGTNTIPREIQGVSETDSYTDTTADQTSNIMSAAAKVDLGQEIDASYDGNSVDQEVNAGYNNNKNKNTNDDDDLD